LSCIILKVNQLNQPWGCSARKLPTETIAHVDVTVLVTGNRAPRRGPVEYPVPKDCLPIRELSLLDLIQVTSPSTFHEAPHLPQSGCGTVIRGETACSYVPTRSVIHCNLVWNCPLCWEFMEKSRPVRWAKHIL
jgi:hypothetical protein